MKELLKRKDVTVLIWVAVSNGLVAGLSYITANPDLYDPRWVGLANVILVSVLKRNSK
jgi:hypothetical protein